MYTTKNNVYYPYPYYIYIFVYYHLYNIVDIHEWMILSSISIMNALSMSIGHQLLTYYMEVSWNGGSPKSSIYWDVPLSLTKSILGDLHLWKPSQVYKLYAYVYIMRDLLGISQMKMVVFISVSETRVSFWIRFASVFASGWWMTMTPTSCPTPFLRWRRPCGLRFVLWKLTHDARRVWKLARGFHSLRRLHLNHPKSICKINMYLYNSVYDMYSIA